MQLICKHCGHVSKSLIVIQDSAIAEVMLDFSKHMTQQHNGKGDTTPFKLWMQDCALLTQTIPTVVLIAKHSTVLDDGDIQGDAYIMEKFSKMIDQVEDMLGVEVFDNKPGEGRGDYDENDKTPRTPNPALDLPHMT